MVTIDIPNCAKSLHKAFGDRHQAFELPRLDPLVQDLERAVSSGDELRNLINSYTPGGVRPEVLSFTSPLNELIRHANSAIRAVERKSIIPPPTLDYITSQLKIVANDLDVEEISSVRIKVKTDLVRIERAKLGPFHVDFQISRFAAGKTPIESCRITSSGLTSPKGYIHPHMREGWVCTGQAGAPIRDTLIDGRLVDFFDVICALLYTYKRNAAYINIAEFFMDGNGSCHSCNTWFEDLADDNNTHPEEGNKCHVTACHAAFCLDCTYQCDDDGCPNVLCNNHRYVCNHEECTDNDVYYCVDHIKRCYECRARFCPIHIKTMGTKRVCLHCAHLYETHERAVQGDWKAALECAGGSTRPGFYRDGWAGDLSPTHPPVEPEPVQQEPPF